MNENADAKAAAAFYKKRRQWIDHVCEHPDVKHATFRVGYWLAMKMNAENQATWWGVDRIAEQIGADRKTVFAAIAELEGLRLLVVTRGGKSNRYSIRLPYEDFST